MKELFIQIICFLILVIYITKANKKPDSIVSLLTSCILFLAINLILSLGNNFIICTLLPLISLIIIYILNSINSVKEKTYFKSLEVIILLLMIVIVPVVIVNINYVNFENIIAILSFKPKIYAFIAATLFCLTPTNIIIRKILAKNIQFKNNEPDESTTKAGRLIGNIERILTLILVMTNKYEAIGLLIAAKSIIRTKEENSEYVLVGTMLSFGIAIITGIIVNYF